MTAAALVLSVIALGFTLLMFGALVEIFRQVDQLRAETGLVDEPIEIDFDEEVALDELDLPEVEVWSSQQRFAVLFLSNKCTTCAQIAQSIPPNRTPNLLTLVESPSESEAGSWMRQVGLTADYRVLFDADGRVASLLGISTTPVAVRFLGRTPISATTVPSSKRLREVLDWASVMGADEIQHIVKQKGRINDGAGSASAHRLDG